MLAYGCKQCGQVFIFGGYRNEFNEYFCSEDCYKKYCESRHYAEHLDRLEQIKTALD
jgi:hypothetical protein